MKKLFLLLSLTMLAMPVFAEDAAKPLTPQQQKMKECAAKNKGLKKDEFQKAQSECMKAQPAAAEAEGKKLSPQQQKMKDCAAKNKGLKGDEYKKAQSACLKG